MIDENRSEVLENNLQNRKKKLSRSSNDKIFLGLCGGIAEYNSFNPMVLRFILMFSLFVSPIGIFLYLLASFFIPKDKTTENNIDIQQNNKSFLLAAALIFVGFYFMLKTFGFFEDFRFLFIPNQLLFAITFIAFGIYNIFYFKREPETSNKKIFYRSSVNKKFLGVCSGFANFLSIDVKLIRILFVVLSILTLGITVMIYFIIAMTTKLEINYV